MITTIFPYVGSYSDIRTACGLNEEELPDSDLDLVFYKNHLGLALDSVTGVYAPSTSDETLQQIFDRLTFIDPMYIAIQQFSIYTVADAVMGVVGLRAYKTMADGKASLTRFSPESAYLSARQHIKDMLNSSTGTVDELLGGTGIEQPSLISVVDPDVDLITGE